MTDNDAPPIQAARTHAEASRQRKDIVLGGTVNGLRIVKSGLSAQDRVIVGGLQTIYFPGAPIAPTATTMDASLRSLTSLAAAETK